MSVAVTTKQSQSGD